jgi:hypothetical protein
MRQRYGAVGLYRTTTNYGEQANKASTRVKSHWDRALVSRWSRGARLPGMALPEIVISTMAPAFPGHRIMWNRRDSETQTGCLSCDTQGTSDGRAGSSSRAAVEPVRTTGRSGLALVDKRHCRWVGSRGTMQGSYMAQRREACCMHIGRIGYSRACTYKPKMGAAAGAVPHCLCCPDLIGHAAWGVNPWGVAAAGG